MSTPPNSTPPKTAFPRSPDYTRREVVQAGSGLALAAAAPAAFAAPDPAPDRPLTRIAFGACAHQDKDQPIWEAVLAAKPDLFVFLGDNVYGDTLDPDVLKAQYAKLAAKPGFQRLRETVPIAAVWDDHDYGENDIGRDYAMKTQSRQMFCDFWGVAPDSPRRTQPHGVFTSLEFGPEGRRVQILLTDLRWNRTPLVSVSKGWRRYTAWALQRKMRGLDVPGPYRPNPDETATMLGDSQWNWLEMELKRPAQVRLLGSSIQVLSEGAGWECWENFPVDQKRLLSALDAAKVRNLVCLSGDVHYGEVTKLDRPGNEPLFELTSSGLTQVMPVLPPNHRRVGDAWRDRNFGLIDIDWADPARPKLALKICDEKGGVRINQPVTLQA
jgi:alkaline phosphatase D